MTTSDRESRALTMYEDVIDFAAELAQRTHGVDFSHDTIDAWKRANLFIFYVDKALDGRGFSSGEVRAELTTLFGLDRHSANTETTVFESAALDHAHRLNQLIND